MWRARIVAPNVHGEGRAACGSSLSTVLLGLGRIKRNTTASNKAPSNIDKRNGPMSNDPMNDAPRISAAAIRTAFDREDSFLRSRGNRRTGEKSTNDDARRRNAITPSHTSPCSSTPSPGHSPTVAAAEVSINAAGAAQDAHTQAVTLWCIATSNVRVQRPAACGRSGFGAKC
jgi:hypothetical protein